MSIITVQITSLEIQMACDTQATSGSMKYNQRPKDYCKIQQFDDVVIGVVGSIKQAQMLSIFMDTNKIKNSEEIEIIRFFKAFESWLKNNIAADMTLNDCDFFIIIEKKVFLFSNFYIREIKDFWAIGSGCIWALPALELGADAKKAVEVACKFDLYCSGEPYVLSVLK